jgi:hypothetical protein
MKLSGVLKVVIATCAISLIAAHLSPATAAPAAQVITCVDLASGKERISKTDTCRTTEATAKWHPAPTDLALASGGTTKSLTICSNKESSPVTYQRIRTSCYRFMQTNLYTRSSILPAKPVITQVSSTSYESASLALASDPAANLDAPIAYYTITSSKGDVKKINSWRELTVTISGLRSSTSYTFTITATSVDGTSLVSAPSLPVTTQVYVAPVAAATTAPLAAPAFTLSASAETKTVNNAITGYTISSTGGTIASYAISPAAPAGTTFSTSTGILSGTPTATQAATAYTITATNATGSATRTFTLTVASVVYTVGQAGPGGGIIYFVSNESFTCGPTLASSCNYLEVAPSGWNTGSDPDIRWAVSEQGSNDVTSITNDAVPYNNLLGVGLGYKNSLAIVAQNGAGTTYAAGVARAYAGGSKSDWYLPTTAELNLLCQWVRGVAQSVTTGCSGGFYEQNNTGNLIAAGIKNNYYWSSSEKNANFAWYQDLYYYLNAPQDTFFAKSFAGSVRPVRAF